LQTVSVKYFQVKGAGFKSRAFCFFRDSGFFLPSSLWPTSRHKKPAAGLPAASFLHQTSKAKQNGFAKQYLLKRQNPGRLSDFGRGMSEIGHCEGLVGGQNTGLRA